MPAGTYILALSDFRPGTSATVFLPAGAVADGSPTLQDYLAPRSTVPSAPTIRIRLDGGLVRLEWDDPSDQYTLEQAGAIGAAWSGVSELVIKAGAVRRFEAPNGGQTAFYRLHQR